MQYDELVQSWEGKPIGLRYIVKKEPLIDLANRFTMTSHNERAVTFWIYSSGFLCFDQAFELLDSDQHTIYPDHVNHGNTYPCTAKYFSSQDT